MGLTKIASTDGIHTAPLKLVEALNSMIALLNSDSCNYRVSAKIWTYQYNKKIPVWRQIKEILGNNAEPKSVTLVNQWDFLSTVHKSLLYEGGPSNGPGDRLLKSTEFKQSLASTIKEFQIFSENGEAIYEFWLQGWHLFYDVFWDFSFAIVSGESITIVIASSSD